MHIRFLRRAGERIEEYIYIGVLGGFRSRVLWTLGPCLSSGKIGLTGAGLSLRNPKPEAPTLNITLKP